MVLSGNPPTTASVKNLTWEHAEMYQTKNVRTDWFTYTVSPTSGYWNFHVNFDNGRWEWDSAIYYRAEADLNGAKAYVETALGITDNGANYVQKGHYTDATWNAFISAITLSSLEQIISRLSIFSL